MSAIALVTFIEIYDPKLVDNNGNITNAVQYRHRVDHGSGSIDNQWNYSHACMMLMEIAQ